MISETTKDLLEKTYTDAFYFEMSKEVYISTSDRTISGYFI